MVNVEYDIKKGLIYLPNVIRLGESDLIIKQIKESVKAIKGD